MASDDNYTSFASDTISPYIIEELENSPTFEITGDGMTAKRAVRVRWQDIHPMIDVLFPEPIQKADGFLTYDRNAFPGYSYLKLDSVSISPFNPEEVGNFDSSAVATHPITGARVELNYKSTVENKYKVNFGAEVMTLPRYGFAWESDPSRAIQDQDVRVGIVAPTIEHTFTWDNIADPPWVAIVECLGKVNYRWTGCPFYGGNSEMVEGVVMFMGGSIDCVKSPSGKTVWSLSYTFSERNIWEDSTDASSDIGGRWVTWNEVYRPTRNISPQNAIMGGWYKIIRFGSQPSERKYLFGFADFNRLFKSGNA